MIIVVLSWKALHYYVLLFFFCIHLWGHYKSDYMVWTDTASWITTVSSEKRSKLLLSLASFLAIAYDGNKIDVTSEISEDSTHFIYYYRRDYRSGIDRRTWQ